MLSKISNLTQFLDENSDLKSLLSQMQKSSNQFWLVGGCLRNSLLNLPQTDIDIACSGDPTLLTRTWAAEISAHWFWLDEQRQQSRVLLENGLILDFSPLRAPSIIKDLQLRDFTINALALPLDQSFPDSALLDPTNGVDDLVNRQLRACSPQSFSDDPLRMLKGVRHAVTLHFTLSPQTREQIMTSADLIADIAGERIRDELGKIFAADDIVKGVELLIDTELLNSLFGRSGEHWNPQAAIVEMGRFSAIIDEAESSMPADIAESETTEPFSTRAIFLLAQLLNHYAPADLTNLLHQRLRLSRDLQRLIEELQLPPDLTIFSLADQIEGQRREALLVEQLQPFAEKKILYWGLCKNLLTAQRLRELQRSFTAEQKFGRIPDLLNGNFVASLLGESSGTKVGRWQKKLKLAEINGEIRTSAEAEKWVESNLDP